MNNEPAIEDRRCDEMTSRQVAEHIGRSVTQVHGYGHRGLLKMRRVGHFFIFDRKEVEKFQPPKRGRPKGPGKRPAEVRVQKPREGYRLPSKKRKFKIGDTVFVEGQKCKITDFRRPTPGKVEYKVENNDVEGWVEESDFENGGKGNAASQGKADKHTKAGGTIQERLLAALTHEPSTIKEIMARAGISQENHGKYAAANAIHRLRHLIERGLAVRTGVGRYALADAASEAKETAAPIPSTTQKDIAEWMVAQLEANGWLLQVEAVAAIEELFGSDFVYFSDLGEKSIDRRVLYHFRKLTEDDVVWVTRHGGGFWPKAHWRKREPWDSSGRTQYEYE